MAKQSVPVNNLEMTIYKPHRFPSQIISFAAWLYHRFNLRHRDVEELLAEPGSIVGRESMRLCNIRFRPQFARRLRRKHAGFGHILISRTGSLF